MADDQHDTLPRDNASPARDASALADEATRVIKVIHEELSVGKREEITGRVRLTKHVDTEDVDLDLEHHQSNYSVERRPIHQMLDTPPEAVRQEGGATVYAVVREVPVIVTRYELIEEIVVTHHRETTTETQTVQRRIERIDVDRLAAETI